MSPPTQYICINTEIIAYKFIDAKNMRRISRIFKARRADSIQLRRQQNGGGILLNILESVSDSLGFPAEIARGALHAEIVDSCQLYIENYTALLEYKRDNIKLKYNGGVMELLGTNFEIKAVSDGNIVIFGKINTVRFI